MRRLETLGSWRGGSTPTRSFAGFWSNGSIPWVTPKDMGGTLISSSEDRLSPLGAARLTLFEPGDIAVVFRSGVLRHSLPVAFATVPFTVNQDIKVLKPASDVSSRYAFHVLRGLAAKIVSNAVKSGTTVESIDPWLFYAMDAFVPVLHVQRQIAAILDTIDEALLKTEQIIAKLRQVKQGLLHDLLTRGIDDNGELRDPTRHPEQFKDSPVGRIPSGWDVVVFGSLLEGIEAGKSPDCPDRPASGAEWGVLKVSAVRPAGFQANENKAITKDAHVETAYEVRDGDLLITRANTYELVGLTCLVQAPPPRLLLCDKTLRLNTKATADRRFIFHTLQMPHVRAQIETHATGSSGSMKNIGQKAIRALRFLLPSHAEQVAIAQILQAHHQRVDTETRELTKLRLLKQGLMEDLLTGRVRVTPLLEGAPA